MLKEFSVEGLKVNGRDILEARKQAKGLEQDKKSKCQELGKAERGCRNRTSIVTKVTEGEASARGGECVHEHRIKICDTHWGLPLRPAPQAVNTFCHFSSNH